LFAVAVHDNYASGLKLCLSFTTFLLFQFVDKKIKAIKARLGHQVYDIFTKGGDEDAVAQKIAEVFTNARNDIELAGRNAVSNPVTSTDPIST